MAAGSKCSCRPDDPEMGESYFELEAIRRTEKKGSIVHFGSFHTLHSFRNPGASAITIGACGGTRHWYAVFTCVHVCGGSFGGDASF
eukprot:SAG11_NODE_34_length_22265_cov_11.264730_22_plen_87_part_00